MKKSRTASRAFKRNYTDWKLRKEPQMDADERRWNKKYNIAIAELGLYWKLKSGFR
jgi:hypothetical protein